MMENIRAEESILPSEDGGVARALPPKQPLALRIFGHIVSYVFHPLFIPTYVAAYLLYLDPYAFAGVDSRLALFKLVFVFFNTAFLPGFAVFLMYQLKLIKSMHLKTQRERIIPYAVSMVFYFWAWYVSRNQIENADSLVMFLLGTFLAVCAVWLLNINNKVSMHSTAMGGMVAFFLLLSFTQGDASALYLSIALLIAGLVCTARFLVSDHSQPEIYIGFFAGIFTMLIAYWYMR